MLFFAWIRSYASNASEYKYLIWDRGELFTPQPTFRYTRWLDEHDDLLGSAAEPDDQHKKAPMHV